MEVRSKLSHSVGQGEVIKEPLKETKGFGEGMLTALVELGCGLSLSKTALS